MRQGNGSKCAALHMTAAMFRPHYNESLGGGLLMTLIFLEMSQNSCRHYHLLPTQSVLLKQASPPPGDVVVPVLS